MASFKMIVALLAATAVIASASNLFVGRRQTGDRLVCYGNVNQPARPGGIAVTQKICNQPRNYYITLVQAIDISRYRDGYASIVKGGIGHNNVTIYLAGTRIGQPLNYTINVFAKPYY